jgi:DNA polymerase-3 subunit gamma/tau
MSYTVLARKWRPKRFADVVGQQHVVQALVNSLSAERVHHAYLFAGTRGVGKTTVARILAKALNCAQGVVAEPCGECAACVAIDEGRFVDLLEVDAASRTRVDDTRELLDNVQYAPTQGRFKIYLIDEVHMLSNHSFNALLKTLEEPPPHVKFLLATTDPQKLPVTVLSRCLQFNLKRLTPTQIQQQLERIVVAEDVAAESDALAALSKGAEGSMRDALSLLDQAIAFGGGNVERQAVDAMLGSIDHSHIVAFLGALAASDGSALLNEVAALDEQAPNYSVVLDKLMTALQRIAVHQLVGVDSDSDDDKALQGLAATMTPEDVQLYYQIAVQGRRDLPACADWRSAFEMTLLRMLAFRPGAAAAVGKAGSSSMESAATGSGSRMATRAAPTEKAQRSESSGAGGDSSDNADSVRKAPAVSDHAATDAWPEMLAAADVRGAARQLAENCIIASRGERELKLILASDKAHLNTDQVRSRLESALASHVGRQLRLTISAGNPSVPTPAEQRKAKESARMRQAREAIESDPMVKGFQTAFDAVVDVDTIEPVEAAEGTTQ